MSHDEAIKVLDDMVESMFDEVQFISTRVPGRREAMVMALQALKVEAQFFAGLESLLRSVQPEHMEPARIIQFAAEPGI